MKAYLAAVLEDLVGEYVLNISKENLKLAALRGKIKLENVELDGDFIGSHILGAVGLSGFGVLSCWAHTLKIVIPWTNLDTPTSLEIHGMHLVCVPLLPTTANRTYFGSQTLRTRAKRAALARFERNFFSGRIPGEGPQQENNEHDGHNISYNGRRRRWSSSEDIDGDHDFGDSTDSSANAIEISLNGSIQQNGTVYASSSSKKDKESGLPALKKKIKSKIYENLVSSVNDIHIRCEVPDEGLNMSLPNDKSTSESQGNLDQRAFAFGLTLKSLSVRNVSEVEPPDNDSNSDGVGQSRQDSETSSHSDGESKTHKEIETKDLAMYWDDGPSFLISESDLLNGRLPLPAGTLQRRIAEAMKRMSTRQDPGFDVRLSLSKSGSPGRSLSTRAKDGPRHDYICSGFSQKMITTLASDASGNSLCFAELLPCSLNLDVTSQQYNQYQLLKNAVLSQQRFDTMLHRRPQKTPLEDPRSWWKYAIACVKHKPTSRSWEDVQKIVRCRRVYLDLVVKNLSSEPEKGGFHGGLTDDESDTLLELEDMLPIETLIVFHLLALQRVISNRGRNKVIKETSKRTGLANSFTRKRSSSTIGRLLNSIAGSTNSWQSLDDEYPDDFPLLSPPNGNVDPPVMLKQRSTLSSVTKIPTTQTTCQLHACKVRVTLLENSNGSKIVTVEFDIKGTSFTSGAGKADLTFDVMRFEVFDFVSSDDGMPSGGKVLAIEPDMQDFDCESTIIQDNDLNIFDPPHLDRLMDDESEVKLPPEGVVCRVTAMLDQMRATLQITSLPLTLIWVKVCADKVADFFSMSTNQIQIDLARQVWNATTPVARRAQMAVLYPTSLSINIDAQAPKLWIPVSPQMLDGALYVDAGKLKMSLIKAEQSSETNWDVDVADIQVMLAGETSGSVFGGLQNVAADLDGVSRLVKKLTTIVHPFQINLTGHTTGSFEEPHRIEPSQVSLSPVSPVNNIDSQTEAASGQVSVKVGRIRLNLVDVEELAKAIGRFYASGVVMMKNKSASIESLDNIGNPAADDNHILPYSEASAFEIIHVCFDKIEMALERYDTQRTYLVEIYTIKMEKKNKSNISFSRLGISDFTIVQLSDANYSNSNSNVRYLKPSTEPQHQLLGRKRIESQHMGNTESNEDVSPASQNYLVAPQTPNRRGKSPLVPLRTPQQLRFTPESGHASPAQSSSESEFIKGCHFHDGENHIDEVEFDVASMILKVTPASISDCATWLARAFELIRVASKEMERRVHDRGRKARSEDRKAPLIGEKRRFDSSIICRVTFKDAHILIGRPASEFVCSSGRQPTDYVVQVLTNASIMTQSIENQNDDGSRTFHISMDDLSASVIPDFRHVNSSEAAPMLNPTAVDCRMVYHTVGEGHVSFQDFSFNCDSMAWKLTPHDIRVVSSVARKVAERLQFLQSSSTKKTGLSQSALMHSQRKGSRIATRIRLELHTFSFIFIRSFKSKASMSPFIDINASQLKGCLDGCIDALNGEVVALIQVEFFNPKSDYWEEIISPNRFIMVVDQIPNELVLSISSPDIISVNLTGVLIEEISDLEHTNRHLNNSGLVTDLSMMKSTQCTFINETGFDISLNFKEHFDTQLGIEQDSRDSHLKVPSGSTVTIDSSTTELHHTCAMTLGGEEHGGVLENLPLFQKCSLLYKWHPHNFNLGFASHQKDIGHIEPVVEFVMQNERIRPGIADIYNLERGQDLLESHVWSPVLNSTADRLPSDSLWLPPYLKDDAREWSDMTYVIYTKKEDFALPDKHWMWVNDWEVEVNSDLGVNDSDGWEYAADFETFSTPPRSYRRGDLCRRRRWTRTRIVKHSEDATDRVSPIVWEVAKGDKESSAKARSHLQFHNKTNVELSFFGCCHSWDKDEHIGNAAPGASLCAPLKLAGATHIRLATSKNSHDTRVSSPKIDGFFMTDQLMILPTGFNSNRIIRASILCEQNVGGFLSVKKLHFVLSLKCVEGIVDLHVEPALKIINLLPCQMQCQLGEIGGSVRVGTRKISQTEIMSLDSGKDGNFLSVDCCLNPHISIRLPGYKWSYWKRIVNRESHSHTWRPTEDEEVALFETSSTEHAKELKSIVHFDHKSQGGDSLDIIMSVEMGHSPTIKFYAQYWLIDKSGLGLNFTGGFSDLMHSTPEMETLRKSHLLPLEANDRSLKLDMEKEGHEWSLGMGGMSLFFSRDEKIAISVEGDKGEKSQWTNLIDLSNPMPETLKTAISVDQYNGTKRYELAYNITLCPSIFSRTRLISFFPRYQIVNLLQGESLCVAQDGALTSEMCIPSQSSVLFHWENSSLEPKIRISSESGSWSHGCIQLDKIGVTAMRIPSSISAKPMVVQAEVRLATKKEDSAIVVTIWASIQKMNPLYLLKNTSQHTIFCKQQLSEEGSTGEDGFIWTLNAGDSVVFGYDDPELPHVLQWTWSNTSRFVSTVEIDAMGSKSTIAMWDGSELTSEIKAEQSTKVILFSESAPFEKINCHAADDDNEEIIGITLRIDLSGVTISVIDNASDSEPGREILLLTTDGWHASFCQNPEGYHEIELRLKSLQMDNFIFNAEHPVLIFCPNNEDIPFLHISAVRSIQEHRETIVFSYVAVRILDIDICLDRKTAETIAQFLHPLRKARDDQNDINWTSNLTAKMNTRYSNPSRLPRAPRDIHSANSGRIYLEKLHLHPLRLSLTFTQEGLEWNPVTEGLVIFQLIRGMASIADAPLIFTSFVVSHAFESPQTLFGIISAHYSSQLSSQILTILGSLVILKTPADILSNVGTGVRDFFYEPINGLVHGPAEFIEGLEAGTSSLVRGIAAGFVRGAASVTELVSHNLANLTDDVFIDERNAYQKKFLHALKADETRRTIQDSLAVAGTCVAIGFRSGANGIFEQPSIYASRHGSAGLVKGIGKAFVGALVKPVVGVGDAAVVVMNHVSETTINKLGIVKNNKRLRRALPCIVAESGSIVRLIPYDDSSARAQQIVTSGETLDDSYLGHIQTPDHLIIASQEFLWIIVKKSSDPQRIRWTEISNFGIHGNQMQIDLFSGPHSLAFEMSSKDLSDLFELLSMRMKGNPSNRTDLDLSQRSASCSNLPGIKSVQVEHVFGSVNGHLMIDTSDLNGESKFINGSYKRVNRMGSFMPNFFQRLDQEAWLLISYVSQMFKGLSSRRCISAGMINGTGETIQVISSKLIQGGSPCYTIPTIEYDKSQGVLYPGGAIIFFGWGSIPSLLQPGNVLMHIETNFFVSDLSDSISQSTSTQVLPTWQVEFLEKSYDENEWWAKYWIMVQKKKTGFN